MMAACQPCLLNALGAKGVVSVPFRTARRAAGPVHHPSQFTIKSGGVCQIAEARRSMAVSRVSGSSEINPYSQRQGEPEREQSALAAALNWAPQLSSQQEAACASIAAFISFLIWAFSRPATIQPIYAFGIACVFLGVFWLARCAFLEDYYQAKGRVVTELGDPDSKFPLLEGLRVHAKSYLTQALPTGPLQSKQSKIKEQQDHSSSSSSSSGSGSCVPLGLVLQEQLLVVIWCFVGVQPKLSCSRFANGLGRLGGREVHHKAPLLFSKPLF
mmetsp:Transcript_22179/g.57861  ORF Transcript_22179/g.57861 Transcript_22179/m.57861 type:complete len:272 (+) Transcript_22179:27-842(+)